LPENLLTNTSVCETCLFKINDFEEFQLKADNLKNELISQIKNSQNSLKTCIDSLKFDTFDDNFQLNENFPEIDFDFNVKSFIVDTSQEDGSDFEITIQQEETKSDDELIGHKHLKGIDVNPSSSQKLQSSKKSNYFCEKCKTSFKNKNSLDVHMSSICGKLSENLPCPFEKCEKIFKNKVSLKAHLICHTKEGKDPSFFCDQCGKGFHYKVSFTQHLKIHSGVRDKQCEVCGFKAISTTHLQRHIRARHTKEKNHLCTICNRAFSER
jgi:hypothetical protein